MERFVVVDTVQNEAWAFSKKEDAIEKFKRVWGKHLQDGNDVCYGGPEGEEELLSYEDLDKHAAILDFFNIGNSALLFKEGTSGVWHGFSSSDRAAIGGAWPHEGSPKDWWLGNGDVTVFYTSAEADGVTIVGKDAYKSGDVHYAEYLALDN